MAMPIYCNVRPRVQFKDGVIYVELPCSALDGEEATQMVVLTRHAGRSLHTSLLASDKLEQDNVWAFDLDDDGNRRVVKQ